MSIQIRDEATVVLGSVLDGGKVLGMRGNIDFTSQLKIVGGLEAELPWKSV